MQIQKDDYLFLCSDGMLEQMDYSQLMDLRHLSD